MRFAEQIFFFRLTITLVFRNARAINIMIVLRGMSAGIVIKIAELVKIAQIFASHVIRIIILIKPLEIVSKSVLINYMEM